MTNREIIYPEMRFGGVRAHRWKGVDLEQDIAELADAIVDSGGEVHVDGNNQLVGLDRNGAAVPLDLGRLRSIIAETIGQRRMSRRSHNGVITWHPISSPFLFSPNADVRVAPNEAVLQRLLDRELVARATRLED